MASAGRGLQPAAQVGEDPDSMPTAPTRISGVCEVVTGPAETVAKRAPVMEEVEESSTETTTASPAATPGAPTVSAIEVPPAAAVAEAMRRTQPAEGGTWGVAEASLESGPGPTLLTAATL